MVSCIVSNLRKFQNNDKFAPVFDLDYVTYVFELGRVTHVFDLGHVTP